MNSSFVYYGIWALLILGAAIPIFSVPYWHARMAPTEEDNTVVITEPKERKKNTVVILFGWGGAKRRHLRRVLEHYRDNVGVVTISYIAPMGRMCLTYTEHFDAAMDQCMSAALRVAQESAVGDVDGDTLAWGNTKVVVHLYSNNGVYTWGQFQQYFCDRKDSKPEHQLLFKDHSKVLGGMIIDSAPTVPWTPPKASVLYQNLRMSMIFTIPTMPSIANGKHFHPIYTPWLGLTIFWGITLRAGLAYLGLADPYFAGKGMADVSWERCAPIKHTPLGTRMHFIYSSKDVLISEASVERYMEHVKVNRGSKVSSKLYEDSPHVLHMLKHTPEYMKMCTDFVTEVSL
eukprot:Clim_evm13s6 gene=Clim_evmTU13s6